MKSSVAHTVLLGTLLCLATSSLGSRLFPYDVLSSDFEGFSLSDVASGHFFPWSKPLRSHKGEDEGEKGFFIALRFIARPDIKRDFEDEWVKYEDEATKIKGLDKVTLQKTLGDNIVYYAYYEWDSYEDFRQHIEDDYAKRFIDFVEDQDIALNVFPLRKKADNKEHSRTHRTQAAKKDEEEVNVLIKYHVPPSVHDEFEQQWKDTAELTWEEEGNSVYALHQLGSNNHEYWVYGSWDSLEDFQEHLKSEHVSKLRGFADKENLVWILQFLESVGNEGGSK